MTISRLPPSLKRLAKVPTFHYKAGLLSNKRVLAIRSGVLYYYSHIPKDFKNSTTSPNRRRHGCTVEHEINPQMLHRDPLPGRHLARPQENQLANHKIYGKPRHRTLIIQDPHLFGPHLITKPRVRQSHRRDQLDIQISNPTARPMVADQPRTAQIPLREEQRRLEPLAILIELQSG